jgi:hypothetical protein
VIEALEKLLGDEPVEASSDRRRDCRPLHLVRPVWAPWGDPDGAEVHAPAAPAARVLRARLRTGFQLVPTDPAAR